jgi:hypothetical protein
VTIAKDMSSISWKVKRGSKKKDSAISSKSRDLNDDASDQKHRKVQI